MSGTLAGVVQPEVVAQSLFCCYAAKNSSVMIKKDLLENETVMLRKKSCRNEFDMRGKVRR